MAETKIEWTSWKDGNGVRQPGFVFNPWLGCAKVSRGCDLCYAETLLDKRYHRVSWGQRKTDRTEPSVGTRVRTSEANWKQPLRWNREAAARIELFDEGMTTFRPERPRVFCASLADWLDNQVPESWREDLACQIEATPDLDWLLLTKRIENFDKLAPWHDDDIPGNVWLGITAEDQDAYDRRWPILARIPARVRFVSYEPACGPLSILDYKEKPEWLICGGMTGRGPGFVEMSASWAVRVMDECNNESVAFFMKQMSGRKPIPNVLQRRQFPAGSTK